MIKEVKTQAMVGVGVATLWEFVGRDLHPVFPKVIPHLVKEAHVVEGDSGLGTVFLFNFGPEVKAMAYQKERLTELDKSIRRVSLEVVEGGHLELGFSYYKTTFQLTPMEESETQIEITVGYKTQSDGVVDEAAMAENSKSSMLACFKCLENYIVNNARLVV